jgi:hypothetical protein
MQDPAGQGGRLPEVVVTPGRLAVHHMGEGVTLDDDDRAAPFGGRQRGRAVAELGYRYEKAAFELSR